MQFISNLLRCFLDKWGLGDSCTFEITLKEWFLECRHKCVELQQTVEPEAMELDEITR